MKNKRVIIPFIFSLILAVLLALFFLSQITQIRKIFDFHAKETIQKKKRVPIVTSIDTMKYSRDLSAEMLTNPSFDQTIDQQVREIASTGATHIAIATPYDDKFLPILRLWVKAARMYKLHVWFRGNFSGWEKWFGFDGIDRPTHEVLLKYFILQNPDLFFDGDIFTPCPECENGGPGDPRQTGDVSGFRQFLIDEYAISNSSFASIGKKVITNYDSMNADVAKLIMDRQTTKALGGIVAIDHYVKTPDWLMQDISDIAKNSGGKVVLGEFGVPIPDITGDMTDQEQKTWIGRALSKLLQMPQVAGINYWVSVGGSTELWTGDGTPKPAVETITASFKKNREKSPL